MAMRFILAGFGLTSIVVAVGVYSPAASDILNMALGAGAIAIAALGGKFIKK